MTKRSKLPAKVLPTAEDALAEQRRRDAAKDDLAKRNKAFTKAIAAEAIEAGELVKLNDDGTVSPAEQAKPDTSERAKQITMGQTPATKD